MPRVLLIGNHPEFKCGLETSHVLADSDSDADPEKNTKPELHFHASPGAPQAHERLLRKQVGPGRRTGFGMMRWGSQIAVWQPAPTWRMGDRSDIRLESASVSIDSSLLAIPSLFFKGR